jgi:hypothetical protein
MPLQQSERRRDRIWPLIGAAAAFSFVIGLTVYGQLGSFAQVLGDGHYRFALPLKSELGRDKGSAI